MLLAKTEREKKERNVSYSITNHGDQNSCECGLCVLGEKRGAQWICPGIVEPCGTVFLFFDLPYLLVSFDHGSMIGVKRLLAGFLCLSI
jgi:hypothetical protein